MIDSGKILSAILCLGVAAVAGCQSKLETGYEPSKLGTLTPTERRGLYAQDFTPEQQAAQNEQKSNSQDNYRTQLPGGNAQ